jgi:hypothetical protein
MIGTRIMRACVVLGLASSSIAGAQAPAVTGVWTRLLLRDSTGKSIQPPSAPAFVIFSANGYFSQSDLPVGRPKVAKDLAAMTKDELLARFQNVDAWRGTYAISGNQLTRKTVADVDPNEEGSELVQVFRFAGDTLILTRPNPANKSEARFVRVR